MVKEGRVTFQKAAAVLVGNQRERERAREREERDRLEERLRASRHSSQLLRRETSEKIDFSSRSPGGLLLSSYAIAREISADPISVI